MREYKAPVCAELLFKSKLKSNWIESNQNGCAAKVKKKQSWCQNEALKVQNNF